MNGTRGVMSVAKKLKLRILGREYKIQELEGAIVVEGILSDEEIKAWAEGKYEIVETEEESVA